MLLLWPLFFLLHYSNMEKFEWPNESQWMYLLLNGIIGTVISEALWLWWVKIAWTEKCYGKSLLSIHLLLFKYLLSRVFFCFCRGCFLTSSLIASVAISLTVPMTMFADVVLKQVHYSVTLYLGALPVCLAFLAIILLAHWENSDPVSECLRRVCTRLFCCRFGHSHNRAIR